MAPPISKETAKTLADTIGMVKLIDTSNKKIQPQYKKMYDGLQGGINDASEDEIALYRPELVKVVDDIDKALDTVQGALALLAQLRADKALMESKFEQIEQLVKSVAATRKHLSEQSAAARKLDDEAEKALGTIKKGALSAEADLGALKNQVAGLMKTIDYIDKEAPKLADAARNAFAKKDQKTLTDSRVKLIDFQKYGPAAAAMRPRIEKYKKQYPDLDNRLKAEVQWLLDDVQRAEDSIKHVEKVVKELIGLGQVPKDEPKAAAAPEISKADLLKCAKAIAVDAKDLAKLGKVLNEQPRAKWAAELTKLATALKLADTDGKAMVVKLNKLDFIRKAQLIDI